MFLRKRRIFYRRTWIYFCNGPTVIRQSRIFFIRREALSRERSLDSDMKHIKLYEDFKDSRWTKEQLDWLNDTDIINGWWEVNADGKIDVHGDVDCSDIKDLKKFPLKFGKVTGFFSCWGCSSLTTLEGAPEEVEGNFRCVGCTSLKTLKGAPRKVEGLFDCEGCDLLTSLEGAPEEVGGGFRCSRCFSLTTLKGLPSKMEGFLDISLCTSLKNLKGVPNEIKGFFDCDSCRSLTTLEEGPKRVNGRFFLKGCSSLKTLRGAPYEVEKGFFCARCPLVPQEEIQLLKQDKELFYKWLKSGTSLQDFLRQKRGSIKGKEFGF